jgi:hypothetical protein
LLFYLSLFLFPCTTASRDCCSLHLSTPSNTQTARGFGKGALFGAQVLGSAGFKAYVVETAREAHPRVPMLGGSS